MCACTEMKKFTDPWENLNGMNEANNLFIFEICWIEFILLIDEENEFFIALTGVFSNFEEMHIIYE